ncbi:uncharacterized protein LOC105210665 isoform X2 [Zeugodacus cucurbitae]|nr:uncharacterized protein LOC105210665 isoform X2 [Zeugodacus cucurbitae]XP_054090325.1 uncharacterized protein LOC105210665 isoform X2 [Zeugodacus cucurbitae]
MCEEAKQPNTKMRSVYEKLIGKYAENPKPCKNVRRIKIVREHSDQKAFHLPPNIYEVDKIPFENRRGLGGAYWHRLPEPKLTSRKKATKDVDWQFYNIPSDIDRLNDRHNHYKGKFRTKTRSHLAAWKGKTRKDYLQISCNFDRSITSPKITPRKHVPKPNPYLFLHRSCVPEKLTSYIMRNQSFTPAVDRYEIKYTADCWPSILKKRSNPQTATVSSQQRSGGKRCLYQLLNAASLTQTKIRLDNKQTADTINAKLFHNNKRPPRVPISRRPPPTMPTVPSNIRFNTIITVPRRVLKCPAPRASATTKKFQLRRREPVVPKPILAKFEYKRVFKFKPLPSPKELITKNEIFGDLSSQETPYFYFRPVDVNKFLKSNSCKCILG